MPDTGRRLPSLRPATRRIDPGRSVPCRRCCTLHANLAIGSLPRPKTTNAVLSGHHRSRETTANSLEPLKIQFGRGLALNRGERWNMKTKLIALMLFAGGALFAETRWSISIGGYAPGYYSSPQAYYGQGRPHVLYRGSYGRGYGGAGYWGESPERQHERAERNGLRNHQE